MSSNGSPGRRPDPRSEAREQAVMLLYEADQRSVTAASLLASRAVAGGDLARLIVEGVENEGSRLDETILRHSRGWAVDRMPVVDRAILRMGIFEILFRPDTPVAVVIDEAVELAKRFSTDDSPRFVNGVLAAVARECRPPVT